MTRHGHVTDVINSHSSRGPQHWCTHSASRRAASLTSLRGSSCPLQIAAIMLLNHLISDNETLIPCVLAAGALARTVEILRLYATVLQVLATSLTCGNIGTWSGPLSINRPLTLLRTTIQHCTGKLDLDMRQRTASWHV